MTGAIRRYLVEYIIKRRVVALTGAIGWASSFAIAWLIVFSAVQRWLPMPRLIFILCIIAMLGIVARPILFLFSRYNPVAAAVEIESCRGDFDQRLITIASQPRQSADAVTVSVGD